MSQWMDCDIREPCQSLQMLTYYVFSPFLQYVSDTASFDKQLSQYIQLDYVQKQ